MTGTLAAELLQRRFRAGGDYELTVYDRLPDHEREMLAALRADEGFYGILRPRDGTARTLKSVDQNTALLWLTLQSPGPLPFFSLRENPEGTLDSISPLLLDGILEVEWEGRFVSGAAAAELLRAPRSASGRGALAMLSRDALQYAESLALDDPDQLAARLYAYGTVPMTPDWHRRLPDADALLAFLELERDPALASELRRGWRQDRPREGSGWIAFARANDAAPTSDGAVYKLYVSPGPARLPETFRVAAALFAGLGGTRFKVGADAAGILRPDKLVFYFDHLERLQLMGSRVAAALDALPAQGVPFTAALSASGIVSWGMDPPTSERLLPWQERESWRLWVVRRLAVALLAAQRIDRGPLRPWEFALERLRHAGVDVEEWTPPSSFRQPAGSVPA